MPRPRHAVPRRLEDSHAGQCRRRRPPRQEAAYQLPPPTRCARADRQGPAPAGGEVRMNGFRKGRTATSVVEQRYWRASPPPRPSESSSLDEGAQEGARTSTQPETGRSDPERWHRPSSDGLTMTLASTSSRRSSCPRPPRSAWSITRCELATKPRSRSAIDGLAPRSAGNQADLAADQTLLADDSVTLQVLDGKHHRRRACAEIRSLTGFQHLRRSAARCSACRHRCRDSGPRPVDQHPARRSARPPRCPRPIRWLSTAASPPPSR